MTNRAVVDAARELLHIARYTPPPALIGFLGVLLATGIASAQVLPTGSTVAGKTIGEWGAEFWNYVLSHPAAIPPLGDDPLTDLTGDHQGDGQSGPVWFMCPVAGPAFGTPVTRTFSVPANTHILVPLITNAGIPDLGEDPNDLCDGVNSFVDGVDGLFFSLDGVEILSEAELFTHREPSPRFVPITVGPDNIFGLNEGTWDESCSDGYFLMLEPLPPGPHQITCGGIHSGVDLLIDVTNDINIAAVVPTLAPFAAIALGISLGGAGTFFLRKKKKDQSDANE
ncbi:MAG: hypothetical protein JRF61_01555 [Deltaproteobacteria bacterium]|jgi:hypothetical protein|nr:hypothetical protein [Deltaproteobacteria bacterium]